MLRSLIVILARTAALSQTVPVRFITPTGDVSTNAPRGANMLDVADAAGVAIASSGKTGSWAVCEVAMTVNGRERTVRACVASLRGDSEIVIDTRKADEALARSMSRFSEGWDEGPRYSERSEPVDASSWRADPPPPPWRDDPPDPPAVDDAWRDDFDVGGAAPWDVIQ